MKKTMVVLLAFLLVFSLAIPQALSVVEEEEEIIQGDGEEGGDFEWVITPDSPFYYVKKFLESVKLLLTFDPEQKVALLEELAEERAKELEALNEKYADGELTEVELEFLTKALDDLIEYVEKFMNGLAELNETDEEINEDEEGEEDEGKDAYADKYLWRIAHLQSIAERAPEAAQKGLAVAIANAERQRARAIAQGKIVEEEEDPEITLDIASDEEDEDDGKGKSEKGFGPDKSKENGPPSFVPGKGKGLQKPK